MSLKAAITILTLASASAFAAIPFNCNGRIPLQTAINFSVPGETLALSGTCSGPVTITAKNLTLAGRNGAAIEGHGKDAITVNGPARVRIEDLTVQHGNNGISASQGAQLTIVDSAIQNNALNGVFLTGASSATLSGPARMEIRSTAWMPRRLRRSSFPVLIRAKKTACSE